MIRLIVMYNLPDGADDDEFLRWRLGPHQNANASLENVLGTDFSSIVKAWPEDRTPRFRFVTTIEWPDMPAFEKAFYDPQVQADLRQNLNLLGDYEYSICESLTATKDIEVDIA